MIFYAYDLEKFGQSGRGFYEPYEEYVPGKVVHTTKELLEEIKRLTNEPATYQKACKVTEEFLNQSFAFQDGESSRRLFERAFEN